MSSGKITLANSTGTAMNYAIWAENNPNTSPVASGTLVNNETEGIPVSGSPTYKVTFFPASGGVMNENGVYPDTEVTVSVTAKKS
jgi:hypothetical protein